MSNLWRGDLQDLSEVDLLEVTEEQGHFESHYRLIKSCFSLTVIQRKHAGGPRWDQTRDPGGQSASEG